MLAVHELVWAAAITGVATAVAAVIGAVSSVKAAHRVKTSNGKTSGELLEHVYEALLDHLTAPLEEAHRG